MRRAEILKMVSPTLIALVAEHADKLTRQGQAGLLVTEVLGNCVGDKATAYRAIAKEAVAKEDPLFDHPSGHRMLKKLAHLNDQGVCVCVWVKRVVCMCIVWCVVCVWCVCGVCGG